MKIVIAATKGSSLINFRGKLIKEWTIRGHDVTCISIEPASQMEDQVRALGANYYCVPGTRTGTNMFADLKMFFNYIKALKQLKPDIYFGYMSKPIAYGGIAARICGVPQRTFFVTGLEIAFYSEGVKNGIVRFILKSLFRIAHKNAQNIVFQNEDDCNTFRKLGLVREEQITIVGGSGIDLTHFTKKPMPPEDCVLMIARLVWSKGIREYIEAARIVKKVHPAVPFLIVGGLDENPEALSREELNGLLQEHLIEWHDFTPDVRPYLEKCSIFVLPSYHEGLGRVNLEAMATGRPVITTNAPGCRRTVIDGKTGFLVPVQNSEILAQRIIALLENTALRDTMAEESFQYVCKEFDVNAVNQSFLQIMGI